MDAHEHGRWPKMRKGSMYVTAPATHEREYAAYVGVPPRHIRQSATSVRSPQRVAVVSGPPVPGPRGAAFVGIRPHTSPRRVTRRSGTNRAFIGRPPPHTHPKVADADSEECRNLPLTAGIIGRPLPHFYHPLDAEIAENGLLHVPGETMPSLSECEATDEVPIRVLNDFTIYLRRTREIIPFESLLGMDSDTILSHDYGASGQVLAWFDEDSASDSESLDASFGKDGQVALSLSSILEVSVHHVEDPRPRCFALDPKIYIRTAFAWYILYVPAPEYLQYFALSWIRARLFHQVVMSVWEDRRMSYDDFVAALPGSEASDAADDIFGHVLTKSNFESDETVAYIISAFADLCAQEDMQFLSSLRNTRLFLRILESTSIPSLLSSSAALEAKQKHIREIERTVVTPGVYNIAKNVFSSRQLEVIGSVTGVQHPPSPRTLPYHPCHEGAIQTMVWDEDCQYAPGYYTSIILDGVRYKAGDCVMVEMGEDANKRRRQNAASEHSKSHNLLANSKWFAKICYFFEKDDQDKSKMFHAQWFQHGAQILLQELAHPQGLFLIDECEDQLVDAIYQKANVQGLCSTEDEPVETPALPNNFFAGVMWDEKNNVFYEPHSAEMHDTLLACNAWQQCASCCLKRQHAMAERWSLDDTDSLCFGKTCYHLYDFVYIRPQNMDTHLYILGQIMKINPGQKGHFCIDARVYGRVDVLIRAEKKDSFGTYKSDERLLFCTGEILQALDVHCIEGKAYVQHASSLSRKEMELWLSHEDHFYFNNHSRFKHCTICQDVHSQTLCDEQHLLDGHQKLRGLELFAGAGGLSAGLEQANFVNTMWAIEWTPSAALTYAANHPGAIVYNQSVNACLKHAILTSEGVNPPPLQSRGKAACQLPSMPKPGDVDFIYGGPPCQGFSKMNHTKKPDDLRNTLVANMISYVDFYRPKFFLLENVLGMFEWKGHVALMDDQHDGDIKMAAPKFIVRAMISLGYQIHFRLLDAGQYGAPQSRCRIIFLGARRHLPLPMFPVPTHAIPKNVHQRKLPTGDILYPIVRYRPHDADLNDRKIHIQYAPHLFVTVEDAISDLPQFDWLDPHDIIAQTKQDKRIFTQRVQQGISSFIATADDGDKYCGYTEGVAYSHSPQNRYQQWMRMKCRRSLLQYHYTAKHGSKLVERTVNVPMEADANHDQLPPLLRLSHKMLNADMTSKQAYVSLFQRIDGKGLFRTALTQVSPNNKGGTVLHPNQKRIITVRECARAQGFSDHWKFLSERESSKLVIQDQLTQIGNAVPIPLALALGREIRKAVLQMWRKEDENEVEGREYSPEIPMELSEQSDS